jgi:hypothetical protein
VVAGEGEPPFGGAFVGREFGVRSALFVGESPPNKATGADGRFKAFVARFALDCMSVAAAHWQALAVYNHKENYLYRYVRLTDNGKGYSECQMMGHDL